MRVVVRLNPEGSRTWSMFVYMYVCVGIVRKWQVSSVCESTYVDIACRHANESNMSTYSLLLFGSRFVYIDSCFVFLLPSNSPRLFGPSLCLEFIGWKGCTSHEEELHEGSQMGCHLWRILHSIAHSSNTVNLTFQRVRDS